MTPTPTPLRHGTLPCCRDRAAEKRRALADAAARGGAGDVTGVNPLGDGDSESALTIRALAKQVADQKAEMERINAQRLAEKAVANASREGGALLGGSAKSMLRAEAAAQQAVQRAQFAPGGV